MRNGKESGYRAGMEIAHKLTLILHFIGLAALLGGFFAQLSAPIKSISRSMLDGAWTMLVTGIALVGFVSADETEQPDHMKFGVKSLVLVAIVVLLMQNRKKESIEKGTFFVIGLLAITNIAIAVLWTGSAAS